MFTFGALGEIISLIDLALEVRAALDDSRGSSKHYQRFCSELDTYAAILDNIRLVLYLQVPGQLPDFLERTIQSHVQNITQRLEDVRTRISKYNPALRPGGSGSRLKDSWRKVMWGLKGNKNAIKDMQRELECSHDQLDTLLLAAQMCALCPHEPVVYRY